MPAITLQGYFTENGVDDFDETEKFDMTPVEQEQEEPCKKLSGLKKLLRPTKKPKNRAKDKTGRNKRDPTDITPPAFFTDDYNDVGTNRKNNTLRNDSDSQIIDDESFKFPGIDSKILSPENMVNAGIESPPDSLFILATETSFWVQRLYKTTLRELNKNMLLFNYFYSIYISSHNNHVLDPHKCLPDLNTIETCTRRLNLAQVRKAVDRLTRVVENSCRENQKDAVLIQQANDLVHKELERFTQIKAFGGNRVVKPNLLEDRQMSWSRIVPLSIKRWSMFSPFSNSNSTIQILNNLEKEQDIWWAHHKRPDWIYRAVIARVQSEREFISQHQQDEVEFVYDDGNSNNCQIDVNKTVTFLHKLAVGLNRIHLLELKVGVFELLQRIHRLYIHSRRLQDPERKKILKGLKNPIYRYHALYQNYHTHCEIYRKMKTKYYWSFIDEGTF